MGNNITIPKRINVGFQNRSDTYTKRLAYVIYWDERGKLHKERSWEGWRDKDIPSEEFENEPTSGFVLNKKVGDYKSGWNHRKAYCRVYDPRGFEFEIGFENLLYILENANSIKGKGLEGEFVYGWAGSDLVLIPTESPDYQDLVQYNQMKQKRKNVRVKELVKGATYITKENGKVVYLGKFPYYKPCIAWLNTHSGESGYCEYTTHIQREEKRGIKMKYQYSGVHREDHHYFAFIETGNTSNKWEYTSCKNLSGWLVGCEDETCSPLFDSMLAGLQYNEHISPVDMDKMKMVLISKDEFFAKLENTRYNIYTYSDNGIAYSIREAWKAPEDKDKPSVYQVTEAREDYCTEKTCSEKYVNEDMQSRFETTIEEEKAWDWDKGNYTKEVIKITPMNREQLFERLKPSKKQLYLANGNLFREIGL